MSEDRKRFITKWIVIVGWSGTLVLAVLRMVGVLDQTSRLAQMGGLLIVLALWGGISRSRFILTDAITNVFKVGMAVRQIQEQSADKTCIIHVDDAGMVNSITGAELLGLTNEQIRALVATNANDADKEPIA